MIDFSFKSLHGDGRTLKAIKQIVLSFGYKGISILIGLAYVPLLLGYLSAEKYGVWLTLTSILGWFSFFNIGLGNGLRNKLTIAIANKDFKLGKIYVSTAYALLSIIFGSLIILFHIINPNIPWSKILNTSSINAYELYLLTTIVFTFFLIRFVVQLISVIYFANQKPSVTNLITNIGQVLSFIIVWGLVQFTAESNIVLLGAVISVIPVIVFFSVSFYAFAGKYKNISPSFSCIDFRYSKVLLNLGVKFFLLQIASIIIFTTSSFFIAQFYGPDEVAVYHIAFKYFQLPVMLYSIILSPLWSATTDAFTKNDFVWLKKTMKRLNFISLIFVSGIIIMLFISQFVYNFWVGDKVIISKNLSFALAAYTILQVIVAPYSNFINGSGKLILTVSLTGVGILVYLLLVYIYGNLFSNSTGIVLAILCTSLIGAIIQPWQTYKILNKKAVGIWNK